MHDWTYESLIRKLKAALAEVEESDPPLAEPSRNDGHNPEVSTARANTTRQSERTRKA
jgi:hypothetical protein